MLAVSVEKEEPVDSGGKRDERMAKRGGLAVIRPGQGQDASTGLPREVGGGVGARVVDHRHGEAGLAAAANDRRRS